jgi:uncharacterized protein (DUF1778 family)
MRTRGRRAEVAMSSRTTYITVRVTPTEKEALAIVARLNGCSLSEFILRSARSAGLGDIEQRSRDVEARAEAFAKTRRRLKPVRGLEPFRVPYLQRQHAQPFEEVVAAVARRMNTDQHSVAILMTYLAEEIANVVASGRVFRWPAFFAVGPYLSDGTAGRYCRPRFQANPPFMSHVEWNCPAEMACNKELDAHRRRRRSDRAGCISSILFMMRHAIALQDLRKLEFFESRWRDDSPTHFP